MEGTLSDKIVLPAIGGIERARHNIRPWIDETPLVRSELLSRALQAEVWIKNETVGPIASFKLRGALTHLIRAAGLKGAVTSSTGNHGQGVAYGARLLGVPSHIFLPAVNNPVKRAMIKAFGATLHEVGEDIDAAKAAARAFALQLGLEFVDDGESLDMMDGAGTVGLECADRLDGMDWIFVPMGGDLVYRCRDGDKGAPSGVPGHRGPGQGRAGHGRKFPRGQGRGGADRYGRGRVGLPRSGVPRPCRPDRPCGRCDDRSRWDHAASRAHNRGMRPCARGTRRGGGTGRGVGATGGNSRRDGRADPERRQHSARRPVTGARRPDAVHAGRGGGKGRGLAA